MKTVIVSFLTGIFVAVFMACSPTEDVPLPPVHKDPVCRSTYDEWVDPLDGHRYFRFKSYWAECSGSFGQTKAHCKWRYQD